MLYSILSRAEPRNDPDRDGVLRERVVRAWIHRERLRFAVLKVKGRGRPLGSHTPPERQYLILTYLPEARAELLWYFTECQPSSAVCRGQESNPCFAPAPDLPDAVIAARIWQFKTAMTILPQATSHPQGQTPPVPATPTPAVNPGCIFFTRGNAYDIMLYTIASLFRQPVYYMPNLSNAPIRATPVLGLDLKGCARKDERETARFALAVGARPGE